MEDITVVEFGRQGRWKHAKGLVMIIQILPTRFQNIGHKNRLRGPSEEIRLAGICINLFPDLDEIFFGGIVFRLLDSIFVF